MWGVEGKRGSIAGRPRKAYNCTLSYLRTGQSHACANAWPAQPRSSATEKSLVGLFPPPGKPLRPRQALDSVCLSAFPCPVFLDFQAPPVSWLLPTHSNLSKIKKKKKSPFSNIFLSALLTSLPVPSLPLCPSFLFPRKKFTWTPPVPTHTLPGMRCPEGPAPSPTAEPWPFPHLPTEKPFRCQIQEGGSLARS